MSARDGRFSVALVVACLLLVVSAWAINGDSRSVKSEIGPEKA